MYKNIISKDFIRFIFVGGFCTLTDFLIYMTLSEILNINISKLISMLISSVLSYVLNKSWVFKNSKKTTPALIFKFYLALAINIGTNVGCNYLSYNLTHNKVIAFVIATGSAMIVNFILQKYFVFKKWIEGIQPLRHLL